MLSSTVGGTFAGQSLVKAGNRLAGIGRRSGVSLAAAIAALAMSLFAANEAKAQNCVLGPSKGVLNLAAIGSSPASVSSMIGTSIITSETAFLFQSTAFVSNPASAQPNQEAGGIWVRGVGGTVDVSSTTSTTVTQTPVPAGATSVVSCAQKVDANFAGVQFGTDISRLNVGGWNVHLGTTAGFLSTDNTLAGGAFAFIDPVSHLAAGGGPFVGNAQIPFVGGYAVANRAGFTIDALLRAEYYQTALSAPASNIFGQSIDAAAVSFSSSITYHWQVPNSDWFIEPSAGLIISWVNTDPFNYLTAATPGVSTLSGTLKINDIESDIGRLGLLAGTSINAGGVTWLPFAAVSVWHEFGPNITSSYATCPATTGGPGCAVFSAPPIPVTIAATSSTSTFGTYGQYSAGIQAVLADTGWRGFARFDYRDGANLQGASGTGGFRYQFTPDAPARGVMPVKAVQVYEAPAALRSVNWTGFYSGVFGGAAEGSAYWGYTERSVSP
jgi:outer membrane autotransporter protein